MKKSKILKVCTEYAHVKFGVELKMENHNISDTLDPEDSAIYDTDFSDFCETSVRKRICESSLLKKSILYVDQSGFIS